MDIDEMFLDSTRSFKKGYQFNSFCESLPCIDSDMSNEDPLIDYKKIISDLQYNNIRLVNENEINKSKIKNFEYFVDDLSKKNLSMSFDLYSKSDYFYEKTLKFYLTGTFMFAFTIGSLSTLLIVKCL